MSNSNFYYLKGKAKWFRPHKLSEYGKWEHVLYPDAESLELIHKLKTGTDKLQGLKNVLKKDDDGYHIRISRPASKEYKGKLMGFHPPIVLDREGIPLTNVNIGNGSDVCTKIEVYQYKLPPREGAKQSHGTAMRWESTRVDNLIPFLARHDFTDGEQVQTEGVEEIPRQALF